MVSCKEFAVYAQIFGVNLYQLVYCSNLGFENSFLYFNSCLNRRISPFFFMRISSNIRVIRSFCTFALQNVYCRIICGCFSPVVSMNLINGKALLFYYNKMSLFYVNVKKNLIIFRVLWSLSRSIEIF